MAKQQDFIDGALIKISDDLTLDFDRSYRSGDRMGYEIWQIVPQPSNPCLTHREFGGRISVKPSRDGTVSKDQLLSAYYAG